MRSILLTILLSIPLLSSAQSPTEGVITHDFIEEKAMMDGLLQMLADFSAWAVADYEPCEEPNADGEACGCFRGENTMGADERGVRPNADLSMVCAFLCKYARGQVELPKSVTWETLEDIAMKSLVFAYSTHKANRLKVCKGGKYWGSVSVADHTWESSLWAMSLAYSAYFQWDKLTAKQREYIHSLLKAECDYELTRDIPTGFRGDTKAEENGWETDVLAAAVALFPTDEMAGKWRRRMREFAVNSYSHPDDRHPFSLGPNLYRDYTLQNHNLFHTSYQNVVQQELGEAALLLALTSPADTIPDDLLHNCQRVEDEVINRLALPDGEQAMPNGNDWSLFLYDQITSYSTLACFLRDTSALMLENMAYKNIRARQQTTSDGSWLLRPDVGARRMGVQAHRVMMTWLMHKVRPTAGLTPMKWADFRSRHEAAYVFPDQNIVRASTSHRFTCFSWSEGLRNSTGYICPDSPDKGKIIVPFRKGNTGNFLGWYEVEGRKTDARPTLAGRYNLAGNSYVMDGALSTNEGTLAQGFTIYSTPGNAVIYIDNVRAQADAVITAERGGLMAISTDPFTSTRRHTRKADGWANIDDFIGFVAPRSTGMAYGDTINNNSILTAPFCPFYSNKYKQVRKGETVGRRAVAYYCGVSSAETARLRSQAYDLTPLMPDGWNAIIAPDPDGSRYLLISNFDGDSICELSGMKLNRGAAPVFPVPTHITTKGAEASICLKKSHSIGAPLLYCLQAADATAWADSTHIYIRSDRAQTITLFTPTAQKTFKASAGELLIGRPAASGDWTIERIRLDERHILIDRNLRTALPHAYSSLADGMPHVGDSTVVYMAPGVYWADDPYYPEVVRGKDGREPFGMTIRANSLHLIGLCKDARDVVIASMRGQTQGAVGNFTMLDIWGDDFTVENMTLGNFCNVPLDYPKDARQSRPCRNTTITQAQVGYVHGARTIARNVRFISRLNLCPLVGSSSEWFDRCHFECTDDALADNALYTNCYFDLYGQKPFYTGRGAVLKNCDFTVRSNNREMMFCKKSGPLHLIDCRYHANVDSINIRWGLDYGKTTRCSQSNFTLNGRPYKIEDDNYNISTVETRAIGNIDIAEQNLYLQCGDKVTLHARQWSADFPAPDSLRAKPAMRPIRWRIKSYYDEYLSLSSKTGDSIVVSLSDEADQMPFCIEAYTDDGVCGATNLYAICHRLEPLCFKGKIGVKIKDGRATLHYKYANLGDQEDLTRACWHIGPSPKTLSEMQAEIEPLHGSRCIVEGPTSIELSPDYDGQYLRVEVFPAADHAADYPTEVILLCNKPISCKADPKKDYVVDTDLLSMCLSERDVAPGVWTFDAYKPLNTYAYEWEPDSLAPAWEIADGFNGAKGRGLVQAQRGARMMYLPRAVATGGAREMTLTLDVDPTKTAGQGFGSPTGQYMDVCVGFDPMTLTGYGLRIERTVKSARAVDFSLVEYQNGKVHKLTEPVTSTCYRTGCTITVGLSADTLSAHVGTTTPRPEGSTLPHEVSLSAPAKQKHNGLAIQHTGTCGESTTMLHRLRCVWKGL